MSLGWRRRDLVCGLALGAIGTGATAQAVAAPIHRAWPKAQATPPLALADLDGSPWRLAEHRGEVVVLNFWASWCQPCLAELPSLEQLAREHAAKRLSVLAVNFREGEPAIRRFLQRQPLALPVLRDADGDVAKAWAVRIFPTTVVVDRSGRVAFSIVGECDWAGPQAQGWLVPLLA